MDKFRFNALVRSLSLLEMQDDERLKEVTEHFPYCQTAHILSARLAAEKGSMFAGKLLRTASLYSSDRGLLQEIIEQKQQAGDYPTRQATASTFHTKNQQNALPLPNSATSATKTLSFHEKTMNTRENPILDEIERSLAELKKAKEKWLSDAHNENKKPEVVSIPRINEVISAVPVIDKLPVTTETEEGLPEFPEEDSEETGEDLLVFVTQEEEEPGATIAIHKEEEPMVAESVIAHDTEVQEPSPFNHKNSKKFYIHKYHTNRLPATTESGDVVNDFMQTLQSVKNISPKQEIILRFLDSAPVIARPDPSVISLSDQEDLSEKSANLDEDDTFLSENLARIYEKQGKKEKAIDLYQKLSLKYPDKSSYFAEKIEALN